MAEVSTCSLAFRQTPRGPSRELIDSIRGLMIGRRESQRGPRPLHTSHWARTRHTQCWLTGNNYRGHNPHTHTLLWTAAATVFVGVTDRQHEYPTQLILSWYFCVINSPVSLYKSSSSIPEEEREIRHAQKCTHGSCKDLSK